MIRYVEGDATKPLGDGRKFIAHICNNQGAWGAGFVLAISQRWAAPRVHYLDWRHGRDSGSGPFELGWVQCVHVGDDTYVANMIAQDGFGEDGKPPIRYDALQLCLRQLRNVVKAHKASVHMPRIGCGIAGGKWSEVEPIIKQALRGIDVTVYDLPSGR